MEEEEEEGASQDRSGSFHVFIVVGASFRRGDGRDRFSSKALEWYTRYRNLMEMALFLFTKDIRASIGKLQMALF